MTDRFYVPQPLDVPELEVSGPEARHMTAVLRLRAGDRVVLFDGVGGEARATVEETRKRSVVVRIESPHRVPAPGPPITLATAVPKGERFRWLVEKATEIGVDRLIPLETARSAVEPGENKLDKLRQVVIAACKQCGRSHLMTVEPSKTWPELIADEFDKAEVFVADPRGAAAATIGRAGSGRPVLLIVGPEGGLTSDEVAAARAAGAISLGLGPNLLRIETAGIAIATWAALSRSANVP